MGYHNGDSRPYLQIMRNSSFEVNCGHEKSTMLKPFEKLAKVGVYAIENLNADIISIPDGYMSTAPRFFA